VESLIDGVIMVIILRLKLLSLLNSSIGLIHGLTVAFGSIFQ